VSAAAMARVGMRVGDYEIRGVIGEGGTGAVYSGRHVASDRRVAIKILHDRGARQKDVALQFIGEATATSHIRHTNVIDMIDLGTTPDGTVFLVMESLEGESLRKRLNSIQRLPLFEAINILRQVAHGLGAAHEAGLVHGGLKPADIFLCTRPGRRRIVRRSKAHGMRLVVEPEENFDLVKLLDFGMARFLDLAPGAQARAGAVSGTLHYLSPEQAQGQPADQRSDIYALGAVFYEMVTGAVPFGGESLLDILRGHVSGQVIAPSRRTPGAGIHMRIDALILKCLKKNPSLRFASTGELCEALDECVTDCAFLRDAHRLPGITESGIDLSATSREARHAPAQVVAKSAPAPMEAKPAPAPMEAKSTAVPIAERPMKASAARASARSPLADDPAAAAITPPPAIIAKADDPATTLTTPPPAVVAADLPAEIPAEVIDQPSRLTLVRSEAILPDVDERPERFDLEAGARRTRMVALAGVLLLCLVGSVVWAVRSGSAPRTPAPAVAVSVPTPAPSPPPQAVAPMVAPAAPAEATPAAELPRPEQAAPAELGKNTVGGRGKLALPRSRSAQTSGTRRTARVIPVPPATTPSLAAETEIAQAPAAPEPPPPSPASVDDLVREAQHAWMAGHYTAAISKAQSALKGEPNLAQALQAYELMATCACAMGKADAALEAASHLSDSKRELVKATCMKHGVTIE